MWKIFNKISSMLGKQADQVVLPVKMQFTAREDFFCDELQSQYIKGLSYTVRPASDYTDKAAKTRCGMLAELVPQWVAAGKIRLGADTSQVRGN